MKIDNLINTNVVSMESRIQSFVEDLAFQNKQDFIDTLNKAFTKDKPSAIIRRLSDLSITNSMLPELETSRDIVQHKRTSINLFSHTLRVIDLATSVHECWAALFHDLGKIETVKEHAVASVDIFRKFICGNALDNKLLIEDMIFRHMEPYQFPKWKLSTAIEWVCDLNAYDIVQLTIHDKMASNPLYVGELLDLLKICSYDNMADRVRALENYYKCHKH